MFLRILLTIVLSVTSLLATATVHAFPELVRHGYSNCVTCHINPGGSGVLNAYGRALSLEALTSAGTEEETEFAWGKIKTPEWLSATLMARSLSFIRDTRTSIDGRTLLMQLDGEVAASSEKFTASVTGGFQDSRTGAAPFALRRGYITYRPTDELSLRTGKFMHVFGLMPADHRIATRSPLGWDQGNETLNVEGAWIGESLNVFATGLFGRPDREDLEQGGSLSASVFLNNRYKVGLNAYSGVRPSDDSSRLVFGTHAALGFTPQFFWLGELDLQNRDETWGTYQYQKLDYEPWKGLHFYLMQDLQKSDWSNGDTQILSWGPGFQWFPRPHLEGQLYINWLHYPETLSSLDTTTVYLMLNFYL
jgi:hypothetical protein